MVLSRDKKKLVDALRCARASMIQVRMVAILLGVNGIDNAMAFIAKIRKARPVGNERVTNLGKNTH